MSPQQAEALAEHDINDIDALAQPCRRSGGFWTELDERKRSSEAKDVTAGPIATRRGETDEEAAAVGGEAEEWKWKRRRFLLSLTSRLMK